MAQKQASNVSSMQAHYERLLTEPSAAVRAETAASVAGAFAGERLSERERKISLDILKVMARDVERQVREALSEHVKSSPLLPPSIARVLAADVESVALPIIQYSSVLSDEDLISIVGGCSEAKQTAVANRARLTSEVSEALVDSGNERVVGALLSNHEAEISDRALLKVVSGFADSSEIQALMVERPTLSLTVCEPLICRISETLREQLISRHQLPREVADQLLLLGRDKDSTAEPATHSPTADVERLVARLHGRNALAPTLLLRAICVVDLNFFQAAMAAMAGIPFDNAGALIFDEGPAGFKAIYGASGLPRDLFKAFRAAMDVIKEARREQRAEPPLEITERILARLRLQSDPLCPKSLDHTLDYLSRLVAKRSQRAPRRLA
ncbi:MAG: DUF2336 domain-containing protein [Rhodospirillales bacterium]|nr:DUF2336 domain-containing protein [Rhodospirillales bacterium]MDH3911355.1 DUF2336 domain-containing protein [Rhodospirillales bacterium]MDH3919407.1 DUF2336 domain-containing protein [Rhodospirillales bacterium]MDH3970286.1 DUF2336 domain-containing protein [Rhodospirillales bacterium]